VTASKVDDAKNIVRWLHAKSFIAMPALFVNTEQSQITLQLFIISVYELQKEKVILNKLKIKSM
jgi:hypothetical protein